VKGLRAASWGAAGTVAAGSTAVALIAMLLPHTHAPEAIDGATYATIARGRVAHLVVTSLRTGGAEAAAGLHVGDAVAAVDGIADPSLATLRREMARPRPIALTVERGGDAIPLTLLERAREMPFDEDPAGRGR
jgi:S1-C subfamily serine protease